MTKALYKVSVLLSLVMLFLVPVLGQTTAPTSITGTTTICNGNYATLTASGGTLGTNAVNVWYQGGYGGDAYDNGWDATTAITESIQSITNNNDNGILNVTSTGSDAQFYMRSLGSFNPSIYKYINVRYRVTAGTAYHMQFFFLNTTYTNADGGAYVNSGALNSDGNWHTISIDMSSASNWTTGGNITGWRFDWSVASGVTMDIDFIQLGTGIILDDAASITVSPTTNTSYYLNRKGPSVNTSSISQLVTVNTLPTPTFTAQPGATACASTDVTYTTQSGQTNYVWTVPGTLNTDYTITSGGLGTTSNTVTLKWLTPGSKTVTINYTNSNGCTAATATSSTATTVYESPVFLIQPLSSSQSICSGASSLNVEVDPGSGTVASYSWFSNASALNSGGTFLVTNTSTIATNSYSPTTTGYYYASITNSDGCSTTSAVSGLVTITPAPVISSQPSASAQSLCINTAPTVLTVTAAAGSGSIKSYKWYSNTSNSTLGGTLVSTTSTTATTNSYTPSTTTVGTLYYYCVITNTNDCSVTTTVSGGITVVAASVGGTATAAATVIASGGSTTVSLTGYTGSIQWQESADGSSGWINVTGGSGGTTDTYTTPALTANTYYRAALTNGSCAVAYSSSAYIATYVSAIGDVLVVSGGGSGGAYLGGGGGGGAVKYFTSQSIGSTFAVTVGAGGAAVIFDGVNRKTGLPGESSSFGSLVATSSSSANAAAAGGGGGGGSGGGGNGYSGSAGGTAVSGMGFNGGTGVYNASDARTSTMAAGGGGGAGATGGNGSGASSYSAVGGNGGVGVANSITGASVYYGGGGGGSVFWNGTTAGSGGNGGGGGATKGDIAAPNTATSGTPNTGGGGGGHGSGGYSGAGGSGVVIVRYPGSVATATGGVITYPTGYVVHTFNSSGTFTWTGGSASTSITSTGVAISVCTSGSAQTSTLAYSASTGSATSYSIDWNAAANTAGLLDQGSTNYTFVSGGGTLTSIAVPANVPAGSYTGIMTISDGSSTITQDITLAIGSVSGSIIGAGTVTSGTNSTTLTLSGYTGSIQWQSSTNNSTYANISGATSATYTASNLTATTFYKAVVTNGVCAAATSSAATITVASPSTAFGITGSTTVNTMSNNVATVVDPAIAVNANGTISGFTVTITSDYTDGDILGYTGTLPFGVNVSAFDVTSRSLYFTGTASAADWQTLLRTVTLTSTSNCYPTNRKVSFLPSNKYYNYFNGHYYEYVSTALSWTAAKAAAASRSFYGRQGYLVTISSEAENNYIWKLIAHDSWIGASCLHTEINSALGYTKFNSTTYGQFYWVTGPEKGTSLSNGLGAGLTAVPGVYNNWSPQEPNNYKGWGENSGHMFSSSGYWNDYKKEGANNGRHPIPYIVEYGGMQGDDTSATVAFTRDIIISGSPAGTVSGATTVCNGTNSTTLTYSGGTIQNWEYSTDNFATAGNSVASTASTLTVANLSSSRYYRAVVNATGCTGLASSAALIDVATTTAGTITALSGDVCAGGNAALTLNGNSGDIQKWQVSTSADFTTGVTDISNTTNALSHPLSSNGTYYFRAMVLNNVCVGGTALYTEGYPVTVTTGTAPVGGTVNSVAYCGGSNAGTLTLSGSTGTSYQWEVSTDGGVAYTNESSTSTTQSYTGISTTTKYRVLVTSGSCGSVYSSVGSITIGGTTGAQWTGTVSTDWGNTANWCGYIIGDDGLDVEISATATYAPILDRNRNIGNLKFNGAGKAVILDAYNLTVTSVTGADSDDFIKTGSSGKLIVSVGNGITSDFPVGNSAYNPVTITNNSGTRDAFAVRVQDEVYANAVSGTLVTEGRVKRTWDISKINANGGDGVDLVFNWNAGETSGLTSPGLFSYTGGYWTLQSGTYSTSGTQLTFSGYTGSFTSFALMEPVYTWTGAGGNNLWHNSGNWSGGVVPTTASDIVISSGSPQLNIDFEVGETLTLSGTGTLTVNAGKTLSIPAGGTADFGGKEVIFKSDATGTAQLGAVAGMLTGATNVVVERHIPAGKRAFRFFSSSVTTTGSIRDNWMEGATPAVGNLYPYRTQSVYNPNLGYGTLITGTGGATNGFDASETNNPSLFTFNNSTNAWVEVANTAGTITAGNAYRMLVRGDRSYNIMANTPPTPTATILRTRGTIVTGTRTSGTHLPALNQSAGGWSLVGNPYQSVVDMSAASVVKTNLTDYYYVWDPRMGTRGAYVAYNYITNTSANVSSAVNRYVQPGQAFFVQSSAAGSAIQFTEAAKGAATNQTATFGKNEGKDGYKIEMTQQRNEMAQTGGFASLSMLLYETDSLTKGGTPADATRVLFAATYSNNVDLKDGRKFTNLDETMSVKQNNTLLSMELRALPDTGTVLPLSITQYRATKYTLRVFWDKMLTDSTRRAYLKDKFTAKEYVIDRGGNYIDLAYTITADAKSSAADRFEVVFRSSANVVTAVTNYSNGDYVRTYPNPVISLMKVEYKLGMQRELTLKVYDMSGREVLEQKKVKSGDQVNMSQLLRGIYQYQIIDKTGKLLMADKLMKD